jgi:hypothetical protein
MDWVKDTIRYKKTEFTIAQLWTTIDDNEHSTRA